MKQYFPTHLSCDWPQWEVFEVLILGYVLLSGAKLKGWFDLGMRVVL